MIHLLKIKDEFIAFLSLHKITNPIYSFQLEKRFNLTGAEVRELINLLRKEGKPIANTIIEGDKIKKIYFWANSWDEMKPTIIDLENRAYDMLTTCKQIRTKFNQHLEPTLF